MDRIDIDRGEIGKQRGFGFHVADRRDRHVHVQQKSDLAVAVRIFELQEPGDVVIEFQEGVRHAPAHEVLVPLQFHQFTVRRIIRVVGAIVHPEREPLASRESVFDLLDNMLCGIRIRKRNLHRAFG